MLYGAITGGMRAKGPFPLVDGDGRLLGPFAAMLANPAVGQALQQLGVAIRASTVLADREREIAILEVAHREESDYEWWAHERVARSLGITEDELSSLRRGEDAASFSEREALVRRVAGALCQQRSLDDVLYEDVTSTLGRVVLADLVHLVGYYRLLALSLATWQIPVPADEGPAST